MILTCAGRLLSLVVVHKEFLQYAGDVVAEPLGEGEHLLLLLLPARLPPSPVLPAPAQLHHGGRAEVELLLPLARPPAVEMGVHRQVGPPALAAGYKV